MTARDRNRALAREIRRGVLAAKNGLATWVADAETDTKIARRDIRLARGCTGILVTLAALLDVWSRDDDATGTIGPGDSRTLHQHR